MNPDIFEAIMLVCFGCAWPFSIYKTWKTKNATGKSIFFISIIFVGYISGILFEVFGEFNYVVYLYILNSFIVFIDLILSIKYQKQLADKSLQTT